MMRNEPVSLQELYRDNRLFFQLFFGFLFVGAAILLVIQQGDGIFFFSNRRSQFGDLFFRYGTQVGEAPGYLVILVLLLMVAYRYALSLPVLAISVTLISFYTKDLFAHLRPGNYYDRLGILDQINLVDGEILNMGANSFPSGHTMSAFALFSFAAFCMPNKRGLAVLFFAVALMVGISRIYLVQHFVKDVYLGAIMGVMIGSILFLLQSRIGRQEGHWLNKRAFKRQNRKTAKVKI